MAGQRAKASFDLDDKKFKAALKLAMVKAKLNSAEELHRLGFKIVNRAQRYAPVDSGRLRSSIAIQKRGEDPRGPYIDVGTRVKYANYVEYGTTAHEIKPKTKKALKFKGSTGELVIRKRVYHPGTKPQPFLRPALLEAATEWKPTGIIKK